MAKNVELLLTENVEALGIVGDVVKVRTGYARNFLLPRSLATQPSEERIKELSAKRAEAQKMLAEQRKQREQLSEKLQGVEVHLTRSCNDQGILYGAITQQDIAAELNKMGHAVKPRDIRLSQVIKRIDTYDVHVKLDSDLDATVKLWVVADRKLDLDRGGEAEEKPSQGAEGAEGEAPKAEAGEKPAKAAKADRPEGEAKKSKKTKAEDTGDKPAEKTSGWGKAVDKPDFKLGGGRGDRDEKKSKKK